MSAITYQNDLKLPRKSLDFQRIIPTNSLVFAAFFDNGSGIIIPSHTKCSSEFQGKPRILGILRYPQLRSFGKGITEITISAI